MGSNNCLVSDIIQNIFCVQKKKELKTGLEQMSINDGRILLFLVNYPFIQLLPTTVDEQLKKKMKKVNNF